MSTTSPPAAGSSGVLSPGRSVAAEARRAARREQLRDFYGLSRPNSNPPQSRSPLPPASLGEAPATPTTPSSAASTKDEVTPKARPRQREGRLDPTSENFVPAEYYELLMDKPLGELLKTTAGLATGAYPSSTGESSE